VNLDSIADSFEEIKDTGGAAPAAPSPTHSANVAGASDTPAGGGTHILQPPRAGSSSAFTQSVAHFATKRGERATPPADFRQNESSTQLFLADIEEAARRNLAAERGICPRCSSELPWMETCAFCRPSATHVAGTKLEVEPQYIFVWDGSKMVKKYLEE
jgi:hypothetical protein